MWQKVDNSYQIERLYKSVCLDGAAKGELFYVADPVDGNNVPTMTNVFSLEYNKCMFTELVVPDQKWQCLTRNSFCLQSSSSLV